MVFFGQLAHLVGHHGKTPTGLASAGRFNGGIKGQQVGLVGNIRNDVHDFSNGAGVRFELGHVLTQVERDLVYVFDAVQGVLHHFRTGGSLGHGMGGGSGGLVGADGHFLHPGVHVPHGRGRLAQLASCQRGIFVRLPDAAGKGLNNFGQLVHGVFQRLSHTGHALVFFR